MPRDSSCPHSPYIFIVSVNPPKSGERSLDPSGGFSIGDVPALISGGTPIFEVGILVTDILVEIKLVGPVVILVGAVKRVGDPLGRKRGGKVVELIVNPAMKI